MSKDFTVYEGTFFCHKCKAKVPTARYMKKQIELSWKCKECGYISVVDLYVKGY